MQQLRIAVVVVMTLATTAGLFGDCNGNGVSDGVDLSDGTSVDCDGNGVPDECDHSPLPIGSSRTLIDVVVDSLAVVDIDRDGRDDVIAGIARSGETQKGFGVFRSSGERTFLEQRWLVDDRLIAVGALDLDADGDLDLYGVSTDLVFAFINDRNNAFSSGGTMALGRTPSAATTADLNGDGQGDLIVSDRSADSVFVLIGDGAGWFAEPVEYAVGDSPRAVVAVDYDDDGDIDIVSSNAGARTLTALEGDGTGQFVDGGSIELDERPRLVTALDLGDDGTTEIVSVAGATVAVYARENGEFVRRAHWVVEGTPGTPRGVAVGDLDGDRLDDLLISYSARGLVALRPERSGARASVVTLVEGSHAAVALGQFDADGNVDLAASTTAGVALFWSGEPAETPEFAHTVLPHPFAEPHWADIGDFDGDGDTDIAIADGGVGRTSMHINDGDGNLTPILISEGGGYVNAVTSGDFNGDGRDDIATGDLRSQQAVVYLFDEDLRFQRASYRAGPNPFYITNADVNGDDALDLLVANPGGRSISVLLGDGDGTFGDFVATAVSGAPNVITPADIDGDRDVDLVIASVGTAITVLKGNNSAEFPERVEIPLSGVNSATLADLDSDGDLDIAATHSRSRVVLYENISGDFAEKSAAHHARRTDMVDRHRREPRRPHRSCHVEYTTRTSFSS